LLTISWAPLKPNKDMVNPTMKLSLNLSI